MTFELLQAIALLCQTESVKTQINCQAFYVTCLESAYSYQPQALAECIKKADKKVNGQ